MLLSNIKYKLMAFHLMGNEGMALKHSIRSRLKGAIL
jgi:hypothetical protein